MPETLASGQMPGYEFLGTRETALGELPALAFEYRWDGVRPGHFGGDHACIVWALGPMTMYHVYHHCSGDEWEVAPPEFDAILATFEVFEPLQGRRGAEPGGGGEAAARAAAVAALDLARSSRGRDGRCLGGQRADVRQAGRRRAADDAARPGGEGRVTSRDGDDARWSDLGDASRAEGAEVAAAAEPALAALEGGHLERDVLLRVGQQRAHLGDAGAHGLGGLLAEVRGRRDRLRAAGGHVLQVAADLEVRPRPSSSG